MKTKRQFSDGNSLVVAVLLVMAAIAAGQAQDQTVTGNLTVTGNSTLQSKLSVTGNHGVLFSGNFGSGSIPASGNGTRMMWYPAKGAFRVGAPAASTDWDDGYIGNYTVVLGTGVAYAPYSVAMGDGFAEGPYSVALSRGQTAGAYSTGMSGGFAEGEYSIAGGYEVEAQSAYSIAFGRYNVVTGNTTTWVDTDPLFVIGNGNFTVPKNALTVLKNGKVSIFGTNPSTAAIVLDPTTSPPQITVGNSTLLVPSSSGNLGIGTSSPAATLHLSNTGDNSLIIEADTDNSGELDNPSLVLRQDGNLVNGIFGLNGDSSGPQYSGAIANAMFIEAKDVGGNSSLQFVTGANTIGGTNGTARLTITNGGNVGIGTSAPAETLDIAGSFKAGNHQIKTIEYASGNLSSEGWYRIASCTGYAMGTFTFSGVGNNTLQLLQVKAVGGGYSTGNGMTILANSRYNIGPIRQLRVSTDSGGVYVYFDAYLADIQASLFVTLEQEKRPTGDGGFWGLIPNPTVSPTAGTVDSIVLDTTKYFAVQQINSEGWNAFLASTGSSTPYAVPDYSFCSDPDSGVYSAGANAVGIATGGTSRVIVNSSGNIGIGTGTPTAKLDVSGDLRVSGAVYIEPQGDIEMGEFDGSE